jgi:outer membrane protein
MNDSIPKKNKPYKYIKQFLPTLFILLTSSTQLYAFDLGEAYQKALTYNADYLVQIAKNQAGQEAVKQARGVLLPQLSGSASLTEGYLDNPASTLIASGGYYTYYQPTATLTFSQVAFDYGKFSAYTRSKYQVQVADLTLENAKNSLIVDVASAYFAVLYADDTLIATKSKKNVLEQQMIANQKKFEAGVANITDYNDAKSAFDTASAELITAENDLINRKNEFRNLTGLNPDLMQPVIDKLNLLSPEPNLVDEWAKLASTNNVSIKIANKQLQMAAEDISIAKGGHIPTLNVNGNYTYNGTQTVNGGDTQTLLNIPGAIGSNYNNATIALTLNVPIYNGGTISSAVREKIATYESTMQQQTAAKRKADQDVRNYFWQMQNGVNLVNAQTQALKSAALQLKSAKLGYQVGTRTSLDLVNSQNAYYTVLLKYNKVRYDYLKASLQLRYYAGQIGLDTLKIVNMNIKQ